MKSKTREKMEELNNAYGEFSFVQSGQSEISVVQEKKKKGSKMVPVSGCGNVWAEDVTVYGQSTSKAHMEPLLFSQ